MQIEEQTLASIALTNHSYIPVLEKYGLDFCCRGKRTLGEACIEKKITTAAVVSDMLDSVKVANHKMPFTEMSAEQLISHILVHHHYYVKINIPIIYSHIKKLATKHGDQYPVMQKVLNLFTKVGDELLPHMEKEERILFPMIKELASSIELRQSNPLTAELINSPIQIMETEHDNVGQILYEIRNLTNQYTPPKDACTTHQVCLQELKAFEDDLHQHVHLENNILFPMAKKMAALVNQQTLSLSIPTDVVA